MASAICSGIQQSLPGGRIVAAYSWHEAVPILADPTQKLICVITDLQLPDSDHGQTLRALRNIWADKPAIVLTMLDDEHIRLACRQSSWVYLHKSASADRLFTALFGLLQQSGHDTRELARAHQHVSAFDALTQRQKDILEELSHGHSNHAIADKLGISEETVHSHVAHLLKKLGVKNRTQASKLYLQWTGPSAFT